MQTSRAREERVKSENPQGRPRELSDPEDLLAAQIAWGEDDDRSADQVAAAVGVSPATMYRKMVDLTGRSVGRNDAKRLAKIGLWPPPMLIDGEERNRLNPTRFLIPSPTEIAALQVGDHVKIGVRFAPDHGWTSADAPSQRQDWAEIVGAEGAAHTREEKFWVKITASEGTGFRGLVANDLVYTHRHGLKIDDELAFERRHVLSVLAE
jgi:hypothetical protein